MKNRKPIIDRSADHIDRADNADNAVVNNTVSRDVANGTLCLDAACLDSAVSDKHNIVNITAACSYRRADLFLSEAAKISRSAVKSLADDGKVLRGTTAIKASAPVNAGDNFTLFIPHVKPLEAIAQPIDIHIVYEDSCLAVVNKAQGMTVHPAAGNRDGTLVNALLYHIKDLSGINGILRPGIVHRLDKDTSGLLLVAKNDFAHTSLSGQIASKKCRRIYLALVEGVVRNDCGVIDAPIARSKNDRKKMAVVSGGRSATTHYSVIKRFKNHTFLRLELKTGRTHQIRVHMRHIGHAVAGDTVYGGSAVLHSKGQLLHAHRLIFKHPQTGEVMDFSAPLPKYFVDILKLLK